ncbi:hypothetical protein C0033_26175 [Clostridium sp. chh4-2]|nr:hypothetical protein C0033_26175 [Clostridium sp. chh4-2]
MEVIMRKITALATAVLMAVTVLAGCSKPAANPAAEPAASTNTSSDTTAAPETSRAETETAGEQEIQDGGILKVGVRASLSCIGYPGKISTQQEQMAACPAIETLGRLKDDGEIEPWLLESYEEVPEENKIVFHIRPDVKFTDGNPLDADAVIWNMQTTMDMKKKKFNCDLEFVKVDDLTVELKLSQWDNSLIDWFTYSSGGYMASPAYIQSLSKIEEAYMSPVGTGPYKLASYDNDVKLVYEKNEDYWGTAHLDGIELYLFSDVATITAAMQTGEIDVVMGADADCAETMINEGYKWVSRELSTGNSITFARVTSNNPDLPTYDLKVRQALAYAVDFDAITKPYSSKGTYVRTNQWQNPTSWAYNEEVAGYPYDVEKAKSLLAEAGYADGFTMEAYVVATNATSKQVVEMMQAYWSQIGVNLNINLIEQTVMNEKTMTGWDGLVIGGSAGESKNAVNWMNAFTEGSGVRYACDNLDIPELREVGERALQATDREGMKADLKEMQKIIIDDYCAMMPIFANSKDTFTKDYVHDTYMGYYHSSQWYPEAAWISK